MADLANKRILLGVTGGIAAYKSAELLRRLQDQGAEVRVAMTRGAAEFITPLTMQALSRQPVHMDLLSTETETAMSHISLARWADLVLVAPATADFMARLAQGRSDDLLTCICLAAECELALAPAMNQAMWGKAATQSNAEALRQRGVHLFAPGDGSQACGETGEGRMMEVADIVAASVDLFPSGLLAGKRLLITAGPTREPLDPVRYLSNRSSGKQGYALAEAALEAGAQVTLVSGPCNLPPPARAAFVAVESAQQMHDAVMQAVAEADVFIGVAAVADYRPAKVAPQKIKKAKQKRECLAIQLAPNPDILAAVAALPEGPFTVGFAAETEALAENARQKLAAKGLDMIVANPVAVADAGFNSDGNRALALTPAGEVSLPQMSKSALARRLLALIAEAVQG